MFNTGKGGYVFSLGGVSLIKSQKSKLCEQKITGWQNLKVLVRFKTSKEVQKNLVEGLF